VIRASIWAARSASMRPNDGRVVSNFIVQALLGHDITVYGDGLLTRSFCYVDDLIDGLIRLMATSASSATVPGICRIGREPDRPRQAVRLSAARKWPLGPT
jgi:nucleoside-diphosphate-sugar epimerase